MENNSINEIWKDQTVTVPALTSKELIQKAKTQRNSQKIGIAVMAITVAVLVAYAIWFFSGEFNWFYGGLTIMITSLLIRIGIEYYYTLKKGARLLEMESKDYLTYLKRYYHQRKWIHLLVTPICFAGYIFGLLQLFPYFKEAFSDGFYTYLIASGAISLLVIAFIIAKQVKKELTFLKELQS